MIQPIKYTEDIPNGLVYVEVHGQPIIKMGKPRNGPWYLWVDGDDVEWNLTAADLRGMADKLDELNTIDSMAHKVVEFMRRRKK